MIVTKLVGGNGNQMFQYAAGLALAKMHNTDLLLDITYLLDKTKRRHLHTNRDYALEMFNISGQIATKKIISQFTTPRVGNKYLYFLRKKLFHERDVFDESKLRDINSFQSLPDNLYLRGYWQSEKYFESIVGPLREEFTFKNKIHYSCEIILNRINNSNSICVIFRRGDFVGHPILDVVTIDYYYAGLNIALKKLNSPHLFVFSDDIKWCQENFQPKNVGVTFVSQEMTGPNAEYYLQLIVACKHFIIPNSTFGWWGAWLSSEKEKLVIAPKKWYKGQSDSVHPIVPNNWIAV